MREGELSIVAARAASFVAVPVVAGLSLALGGARLARGAVDATAVTLVASGAAAALGVLLAGRTPRKPHRRVSADDEATPRAQAGAPAHRQAEALAALSHDLRSSLGAVIGALDLLREGDLDVEQRELACLARGGCDALLGRMIDLAQLVRLDDPVPGEQRRPVEPARTLEQVVEVEAGVDLGTEVEPRVALEPRADPAPHQDGHAPPRRVLVVDDDPLNRRVSCLTLESLGCLVDLAGGGREAIGMALARPYDLIFMDCTMPDVDGFATTAELRRRLGTRLPILALTGSGVEGSRQRCLSAGMDGYLVKPVTAGDLAEQLERWAPRPGQRGRRPDGGARCTS